MLAASYNACVHSSLNMGKEGHSDEGRSVLAKPAMLELKHVPN